MQNPISLKSAEKQAFRAAFADGLWDVLLGCFVLLFALAPLLSETLGDFWSSFIFLPFWGAVYLAIWLVRRHIVAPRLGRVSFGKARVTKLRRLNRVMLGVTAALFLLGLVVVVLGERAPAGLPALGSAYSLGMGLLLLGGFSAAAFLLDYPRLYVYGILLFAALPLGEWLYQNRGAAHHGYPLVFGAVSALMILAGLAQFAWMLKTNPPVPAEVE